MKKAIIFLILLVVINSVLAVDLSDYPDMFVDGNHFNAIIVVGDDASSSDVLAQSSIGTSLVRSLDMQIMGINKLASEVDDIEMNIISIGNPCVNEITDEIMDYPSPCDKDFEEGKAYLKLYEKEGYSYLVVAGYSDEGTREIADVLADYEDYDLTGTEYVIDLEKTEEEHSTEDKETESEEETEIEDEKQNIINELTKKIESNKQQEPEEEEACEGCLAEGKCLSTGERIDDRYCADGEIFKQKTDKEECSLDYECLVDKCTDGHCGYKKEGTMSKIINWLKSIFGK